jgi:predicted acetyltransferase
MTVPGGEVEVGYVTAVGVRATHRRRGINTQLMRRQLDDAHERGELVEVLHASEGAIYGRYGYGLAALGLSVDVDCSHASFVRGYEPSGRLRLVERAEAVPHLLAVHEATRGARPGMLALDERRLDYCLSHDHGPDKGRPSLFVLHDGLDGVDGFAIYRVKHDWPGGSPASILELRDLQATSPAAYADLWRYVLDVDLMGRVTAWGRPVDEPLLHLAREPRRLNARILDSLWVRLVDVAGALAVRAYGGDGRLVVQVADSFCAWNEGRYVLDVSGSEALVSPEDALEADIACTATDLGAAYLGGTTFRQLFDAGRIEERSSGAIARADALFGWGVAPYSPYEF